MKHKKLKGLIAAVHTPVNEDYSLNLACVQAQANHLVKCGVVGVYVSGTTGEGQSFTPEERMNLFQTWGNTANENHLIFIAHIGHMEQAEAANLALAAKDSGAHCLSAMCPKNSNMSEAWELIKWLKGILAEAGNLPFYYYDSPTISGTEIDMVEFLKIAVHELPSLVGLKFNNTNLALLKKCLTIHNGQFDVLFGVDEMLISGMDQGCRGAVGSSYNFAAPIYQKLIKAYESGDRVEAEKWQDFSIQLIDIIQNYDYLPTTKILMKKLGVDCGPAKPPHRRLSKDELDSFYNELNQINFFEIIDKQ